MVTKKEVQGSITALEDIKGLYTQIEQNADNPVQKQEIKTMLGEAEKHYQYMNQMLISLEESS